MSRNRRRAGTGQNQGPRKKKGGAQKKRKFSIEVLGLQNAQQERTPRISKRVQGGRNLDRPGGEKNKNFAPHVVH